MSASPGNPDCGVPTAIFLVHEKNSLILMGAGILAIAMNGALSTVQGILWPGLLCHPHPDD